MSERQSSTIVSTRLERIAKLAKERPNVALTTLAHHIDVDWLREAYRRTRKDGAPGIDGQDAKQYAEHLEGNLKTLLDRAKDGSYRAPPVRRVHIPKGDGTQTRPIGIPTFEDKVLQRAVTMVLEAVYEQSFHDFSYGFRPGRSAHQALEALRDAVMGMHGGWIVEVDIRKFFDTLDHARLREILHQRVRDGVLLRLIGKWLNAGVLEGNSLEYPEEGTPQGGVISPLLANIYLHEVLDEWFVRDVRPRLQGQAALVRYADDFVFVFEQKEDALRILDVLPERFGMYGLELHPDKTRLVEFTRPSRDVDNDNGDGPGSFDLLGFTHYWAKSRKGNNVVKRKTAKDRFCRALRRIYDWCRTNRHRPVAEQHATLKKKLVGHYRYYGLPTNAPALKAFRFRVVLAWWKWLSRRSQKARLTGAAMTRLLARYPLPDPTIGSRQLTLRLT
jgi:RNA-directed DNA polymerase